MPPPQRYDAPHQQLLRLALAARRSGVSFDEFWARTVPAPKRACPSCGSPVPAGKRCSNRRPRSRKFCGGIPTATSPWARDANDRLIPDGVLYRASASTGRGTGPPAPFGQIGWPHTSADRLADYTAIAETREGWRRTYEGLTPTQAERAFTHLATALETATENQPDDAMAVGGAVA